MRVWARYYLLQIPGWTLVAVAGWAAVRWLGVPGWFAAAAWAVYFVKDFLLYPYLKHAFETDARNGAERLIGETGVVQQILCPQGFVRVRGELWQARADQPGASIAAGTIPPLARQRILRLTRDGVTVVLCTGAASGPTAEDYYYPGAYEDLLTAGVIIEDHLTSRKARIRLMISLGLQIPYAPFGKEFVLSALLH